MILSNGIYHTTLYIVMDEIAKVISHMCHEPRLFVWEKSRFLVTNYFGCYYLDKFESKPMNI
jgi:hypothetical protein